MVEGAAAIALRFGEVDTLRVGDGEGVVEGSGDARSDALGLLLLALGDGSFLVDLAAPALAACGCGSFLLPVSSELSARDGLDSVDRTASSFGDECAEYCWASM
jgi:hypothetical protein